ncbi:DUF421 domain-containing protein [Alkalihalobacterium elongatum]|uniref:DUF421 domain-containing protein n=1 Tax=Alkalihalobacterium elongatum TaxID=2675466 RepID=UPI001C1F75F2|nr:DUF421 domain-containing protein [Alkalihalobacterium elongatum]
MELAKELIILFFRIITILPLILIATLLMGKRSIAELPVFDFLVVIILGAVVGADIADPNVPHIHTGVAIILIGLFQILVAKWKISNRKIRRLITFEPTLVISEGKFIVENLRQIRYSIDNILQMLREKEIFDVSEVELAIIEGNGNLSVHRKPKKANVKIEDLGVAKVSSGLAYPVIIEGKVYEEVLTKLNVTEAWLQQELNILNVEDVKSIFFASITEEQQLHISLVEDKNKLLISKPSILS